MKFLHTGDWHLGKRLERFDRSQEQRAVLKEICQIADEESVDLVLISGDLYDSFNPPNQSVEDFFRTVKDLSNNGKRAVVAIAGNHDSPQRVEAPDPLARASGILFSGFPDCQHSTFELDTGLALTRSAPGFAELQLPGVPYPIRLFLTPYTNETRARKALGDEEEIRDLLKKNWEELSGTFCDTKGVNLLVAHLYMMPEGTTPPEEPEDERPIRVGNASVVYTNCIPDTIQYVAMGHLHRYQVMKGGPCPVVYPSSILGYSFSEARQKKYVVIGEVQPGGKAEFSRRELNAGLPLERKTFEKIDDAIVWLAENQECYVELTIRTDSFIEGVDRKRLMEAHPRIVGPIPEITGEATGKLNGPDIDPTKGRKDLFRSYFEEREGVKPSNEIMELLEEVLQLEVSE